jgi:uncharacterized membrane protein
MNTPTLDLDLEAPDAFALLTGLMLVDLGVTMAGTAGPSVVFALCSIYVFGTAVVLVGAALVDLDWRRWGRPLAAGVVAALLAVVTVAYLAVATSTPGTDVMAFQGQAAALAVDGTNPYTASLSTAEQFPTAQLDGGYVDSYSYPAGAVIATLPTYAVGHADYGRLAVLVATALLATILVVDAPPRYAILAPAGVVVNDLIMWPVGALVDALWLAPLALALRALPAVPLAADRLDASAVAIGVATTMKQIPWFVTPFVLVWVLRTSGRRAAARYVAVAVATFGLVNSPLALTAPQAWLHGALTPIVGSGAPLVHSGVGLSALTRAGVYALPRWYHTALVVAAALGGLAWYWRRFEHVRYLGWVAWAPLLLLHYRSFPTYISTAVPIATLAFFARTR